MKVELQVSDIAMYLPYRMTFLNTQGEVKELDTISMDSVNIKGRTRTYGMYCDVSDIKPVLRPISDFDKIPNDFDVDTDFEASYYSGTDVAFMNTSDKTYLSDMVTIHKYLIENLFDINDLIGQGLAVDINSIEK